tara:strand:+ start:217 stop:870 length:654 start_codon:yes stop_codon:yes gene_type:complete
MQKRLSLILADTKRSYSYLNELILNKINIENILIYSNSNKSKLFQKARKYRNKKKIIFVKEMNINSKKLEKKIKLFNSDYILFSGYSAEIIKNQILMRKNLIHCHPGLLPKYRGSTVMYYSLILDKQIFVSIFKISKQIDSGKLLYIKKFNAPSVLSKIESEFDNKIRSNALVNFILEKNKIYIKKKKTNNLTFYYISHPIIRNILLNPLKILLNKI